MAVRFRSRDTSFVDLFTVSANHLVLGAGLLAELLADGSDHADIAARMREAEHAADETTHEIVRRVTRTFVTPFDREDIYLLASRLDDVMDHMEEAVDLVMLYKVADLPAELADQVEVISRCAELTVRAMPRLRSPSGLEEYWIEVNRLENVSDKAYRRLLARLLSGKYKALEVLKLKGVLDALEAAVDAFEQVANVVERIVVKES